MYSTVCMARLLWFAFLLYNTNTWTLPGCAPHSFHPFSIGFTRQLLQALANPERVHIEGEICFPSTLQQPAAIDWFQGRIRGVRPVKANPKGIYTPTNESMEKRRNQICQG